VYSSATTTIGYDVASIILGLPHEPFHPETPAPALSVLRACTGTFQFGQDFYQPNAKLETLINGSELSIRWPGGSLSPLIPIGRDHFLDRAYWEQVTVERDASGELETLVYGQFRGSAVAERARKAPSQF
jgi:hypothetical protein